MRFAQIIREAGRLIPLEIKSSSTFSPDFLKSLSLLPSAGLKRLAPGFVLYNGDRSFTIGNVCVINPLHLGDPWKTLTGTGKE